jgi:hypothetical protein
MPACLIRTPELVRWAKEIGAVLPPSPSPELSTLHPELLDEWQAVVCRAARGIAERVGCDLDALRSAIGPPLEIGIDPPWRLVLKLSLIIAHGASRTLPDAITRDEVSMWLSGAPRHTTRRRCAAV